MVDQLEKRKMIVSFSPADDFEVVPHIRSVIALDDDANHDMDWDSDEPWEHIYDNNGEEKASSDGVSKFGRLTYARVAGTGCQ